LAKLAFNIPQLVYYYKIIVKDQKILNTTPYFLKSSILFQTQADFREDRDAAKSDGIKKTDIMKMQCSGSMTFLCGS
jgi:hypothetical protein